MNYFLFILFLFASSAVFGQSEEVLDCSYYKTGRFILSAPEGDQIKIKRTKKYQIETYNKAHKKHKFKIEWTSDCEYFLTLSKTTCTANEVLVGKGLLCKILAGKESYYSCIIISPEHPAGRKCELTKLR